MSTYEIHAYDIVTGTRILDTVPFATFKWAETLNDLPLRDSQKRPEFVGVLAPDDSASLPYLTPGKTMLVVEDTVAGAPIYVGIIWKWEFNREQHGFDVWGESVWSYWRRRLLVGATGMTHATAGLATGVVYFQGIEQFDMVADLFAHAVATGASADLQFTDVRYNPGGAPSGVTQMIRWYDWQFRTIAATVEELARLDDGFDFVFSYGWAGTDLLLYLDLWSPGYGSAYGVPLIDGDNVTVVMLEYAGSDVANRLTAIPAVLGESAPVVSVDDANRADLGGTYPYLHGTHYTREGGRDVDGMTALADARLLFTREPVYSTRVEVSGAINVGGIAVGDTVDFVAAVSGLDIAETMRAHGRSVRLAAGELDVWSLDLVDSAATAGVSQGDEKEAAFQSRIAAVTHLPTQGVSMAGAAFVTQWKVILPISVSGGIEVYIPWLTDAGTTAEVRLASLTGSGAVSDAVALAAGSNGYFYLRWLHGTPVGSGPVFIGLQARRTSGFANVWTWAPAGWTFNPRQCTLAGIVV